MLGNSTETTAMQRLGHVLGWTGFAIGGLTVAVSTIIILVQAWGYFYPAIDGTGYEMTLPDGQSYIALGVRDDRMDAEQALRKHLGEEVLYGPYGDWKVFSSVESSGEKAAEFALEKERVRALKRAKFRSEGLNTMGIATILGIVPGVMIILLGLALRYIFTGPMKPAR